MAGHRRYTRSMEAPGIVDQETFQRVPYHHGTTRGHGVSTVTKSASTGLHAWWMGLHNVVKSRLNDRLAKDDEVSDEVEEQVDARTKGMRPAWALQ